MEHKPLVSIITPCYNMSEYIHRLLESVLEQTYKNIELIVIDDGSKDNSKNIILGYEEEYKKNGMKLVYIYQENSGQAEAINKGLSVMTGEYMTWIDSDDYLKSESVEKRVSMLKKYGKGYFCITQYEYVNHSDLKEIKFIGKRNKPQGRDNFFEDLIIGKNVVLAGSVMIRKSDWLKVNLDNEINPCREGQNFQLMLPITYFYKCLYIEEPLYVVVEHGDSHSRSRQTPEQFINRQLNIMDLQKNIIADLQVGEELMQYYTRLIYSKRLKKILNYCLKFKLKKEYYKYYMIYKKKLNKSFKNKIISYYWNQYFRLL